MWPRLPIVVALMLYTPFAMAVGNEPYQFTLISESSRFVGEHPAGTPVGPAINASGQVAFRGALDGMEGIYVGDGQSLQTLAIAGDGLFAGFGTAPDINDRGQVAFLANLRFGQAICTAGPDEPPAILAQTGNGWIGFDPLADNDEAFPAINNAGTVVFPAIGKETRAIVAHEGQALRTIVETGGQFSWLGRADLNNAGQVVLQGHRGPADGVYVVEGDEVRTIAAVSLLSQFSLDANPTLNEASLVAYRVFRLTGSLMVGDGVSSTTIATGLLSDGGYALNDEGTTAFYWSLFDVPPGIFVGPDLAQDAVIREGDPLLGSRVESLFFSREGLNDAGQIAFMANLEDGRTVIVRADPIPEPGGLVLLATGMTIVLARKRPVSAAS